jgi:hypothetical protein
MNISLMMVYVNIVEDVELSARIVLIIILVMELKILDFVKGVNINRLPINYKFK